MQALTGDQSKLRRHNRAAILRHIWQQPGVSRAMLAQLTGLTKATVGSLVQELHNDGWLRTGLSTQTPNVGRPSIPIFLNRDRAALIGIEISTHDISALAITPNGDIVGRLRSENHNKNLDAALGSIAQLTRALHNEQLEMGRKILGVGVGVPGPVDAGRGVLQHAPNLGWHNLPLKYLIGTRLEDINVGRIHVNNDSNMAAMSEYLYGSHRNSSNLVFLYLTSGIGGGLIIGQKLLLGQHGFAGEVGHITIVPNGARCACGNNGCSEVVLGPAMVLQKIRAAKNKDLSWFDVLGLARKNDPMVHKIVRDAAVYLGVLLGNLMNTVDASTFVLGGIMAELDDLLFLPAIREAQQRTFGREHRRIRLEKSTFGLDACAVGAAGHAFHNLLEEAEDLEPLLV